jgi:hypothetical protein
MAIPIYFTGPNNDARPQPGRAAGSLEFSDKEIFLIKTADGAVLRFAYRMQLVPGVHVLLTAITAEIGFQGKQLHHLPLGIAVDPECHVIDTDYQFPMGGLRQFILSGNLQLPLTRAALEAAERIREGEPPAFTIVLHGSAFVANKETGGYDLCRVDIAQPGPIQLRADRDVWQSQVRNASPMGSVLVEIPLAVTRDAPWDRVWARLDAASASLSQGGESGNKHCVIEVRQALDAWRKIDQFETTTTGGKQKDKGQRLRDVANALYHYFSLSAHGDEHQEEWTRAEAILALSSLCALLSARNP